MVRSKSLATMSFDALIKLRDDVTDMLSKQAVAIQEQLAGLTNYGSAKVGNGGRMSASKLMGRKAPVKYRDKEGNKWSGRGAQPRWMTAAIKAGAKRDDFLVEKATKGRKASKPAKKSTKRNRNPAKKAQAAKPAKKKRIIRRKPNIAGTAPSTQA